MKHLAPLLVLAACGAGVPENPTYFGDVQAILRANCARCHGADPADPKVATFRLDRYVKDDASTLDAYDFSIGAEPAMERVAVNLSSPAMPPDYALTDRQRELLARWIAAGAPKGTRDNRVPRGELVSPLGTATADQSLDLVFRTWDDDLDGLAVQLWARDLAGGEIPLGARTGGGLRSLTIDTGTLASKHAFELYAVVDDGFSDDPDLNKHEVILLPDVFVDHGARGTAPTVRLLQPDGGDTKIGALQIDWSATDPDVDGAGSPDVLTIDIDLVRLDDNGNEVIDGTFPLPIATSIANTGTFTWTIPASVPTADGATPIPYKVRVTATDTLGMPPNLRSDASDLPLYIEGTSTTTYTWADVAPLFDQFCKDCHGATASTPALDDFCLLQYEKGENTSACEATDLGAYELRTDIFSKSITTKSMPPAAEPQPTQAQRDIIADWIRGGAPYGSGPVDARPTFTWTAPSNTMVLDGSVSGMVTLRWTSSDDAGLAAERVEYLKASTNATACNQPSTCSSPSGTWQTITTASPSGTSSTGMFGWTAPAGGGCYCVRGTVTDSANQTGQSVAGRGVKF